MTFEARHMDLVAGPLQGGAQGDVWLDVAPRTLGDDGDLHLTLKVCGNRFSVVWFVVTTSAVPGS